LFVPLFALTLLVGDGKDIHLHHP